MKKLAVVLSVAGILASGVAKADGFVCGTSDRELTVKVYNNTHAAAGTRNAAIMVVSDPTVQRGNQTIAVFRDTESTLTNLGAYYMANVQAHLNNGGRGGEYIGGTRLAQLDSITLSLNFSYAKPIPNGQIVPGYLLLKKVDGSVIKKQIGCARYLKN